MTMKEFFCPPNIQNLTLLNLLKTGPCYIKRLLFFIYFYLFPPFELVFHWWVVHGSWCRRSWLLGLVTFIFCPSPHLGNTCIITCIFSFVFFVPVGPFYQFKISILTLHPLPLWLPEEPYFICFLTVNGSSTSEACAEHHQCRWGWWCFQLFLGEWDMCTIHLIIICVLVCVYTCIYPWLHGSGFTIKIHMDAWQLFLLRAAGFLLPCYIMAWAISILQRRRQRQVSVWLCIFV